MYVLDTNTVIYFFKGQGRIVERLLAVPPSAIAIPTIVLFELETGLAKSTDPERRLAQLRHLTQTVELLPFGADEARAAASLRATLERDGMPIGPMDTLIAGTTLAAGGTLVTRNVRELGRVPGLTVEDWYA